MPRLKVFEAHLGFFDTVVAAPSQKAALEIWGSRQNLFRDGTAKIATDPDAIKPALAQPGIVLKRLSGSDQPFTAQPQIPATARPGHQNTVKPRQPKSARIDRRRLESAQRAVAQLQAERQRMESDFAARELALGAERQRREQALQKRQDRLNHELQKQQRSRRARRARSD